MQFTVHVNLDNDAFCDGNGGSELADILQKLVNELRLTELEAGRVSRLRDSNGNRVGFAAISDKPLAIRHLP